jgi:outer membrane lipoprotein SlyB
VFDHQPQAEAAVADLWGAGFARDRVDMVTRSQGVTEATPDLTMQKDAADGAVVGAFAGASVGAVAGAVATLLIPGIGIVIGGGLLAGILGGAALGAAGGTFLGPFVALGMDEASAHHYARHLDEGRTVVLVRAYERAAEASAILSRHGGHDRQPAVLAGVGTA